mmetsp:Transcript_26969/g.45484  ORF Transcript_26969/g.45484 Transcript_26969/m.45484 type:complete len:649 (+) Transcript_26969:515-2461(+)
MEGKYLGLYIGLEDGFWRHFPHISNASVRLPTMSYTCLKDDNPTPVVGYDPRCRGWYVQAKQNTSEVVFTSPYIDASTGDTVITLAKAVLVDNKFIGAVGMDVNLHVFVDAVMGARTAAGHIYLSDIDSNIILHPDGDLTSGIVQTIRDVEFATSTEAEWGAFQDLLGAAVYAKNALPGTAVFSKDQGELWQVTYGAILGTPYYFFEVYPHDAVAQLDEASSVYLIITLVVAGIVVFAVGLVCSHYIANKVSIPVLILTKIMRDVKQHHRREEHNEELQKQGGGDVRLLIQHDHDAITSFNSEISDINVLHAGMQNLFFAVQFANEAYYEEDYDIALEHLREVEIMFAKIGQLRALGIIYNNRGNILRRYHSSTRESFTHAIKALELAVQNARTLIENLEEAESTSSKQFRMGMAIAKSFRSKISEQDRKDEQEAQKRKQEQRKRFALLLATRLSNLGDCLREAGHCTHALQCLRESNAIFNKYHHQAGTLLSMGNLGLVFQSLERFEEAREVLEDAVDIATEAYATQPEDSKTLVTLQHACMNLGALHMHIVENALASPSSSDLVTHVELALHHLYQALTISFRIQLSVQTSCVAALQQIYHKHYPGEEGQSALAQLATLYPDSFAISQKVGILNAIHVGEVEMENL